MTWEQLWACGEKRTLTQWWWECKLYVAIMENNMDVPQKLKSFSFRSYGRVLPYNPAVSLWIYRKWNKYATELSALPCTLQPCSQ
jgi:hypothetical protein